MTRGSLSSMRISAHCLRIKVKKFSSEIFPSNFFPDRARTRMIGPTSSPHRRGVTDVQWMAGLTNLKPCKQLPSVPASHPSTLLTQGGLVSGPTLLMRWQRLQKRAHQTPPPGRSCLKVWMDRNEPPPRPSTARGGVRCTARLGLDRSCPHCVQLRLAM